MGCTTLGCIVTLTLSMLVASLVAEAQQPTKVHRIGWLSDDFPPSASTSHAREEAFRQGLRALGYVAGQNLVIESRYAERRAERLRDLAAELVRLQVEVLVAGGAPAIRAAHTPRARSQSSWRAPLMRWHKGSSPAWRAQGGTSRA